MVLINARDLAHDSGVKLSPCMCSHISCPSWRNGWYILSEDLLVTYALWLKQSTVTHPAVCHDKVVNQQFAACSGSPHDDNHLTSDMKYAVYRQMLKTIQKLIDAMCGHFNHNGQLCGECKPGYSPPVYSYDLKCTMCSDGQYNWIKYVAIAFVPLTVFLVLVLCCRISATSPQLNAFILFSQALSFPANVRTSYSSC